MVGLELLDLVNRLEFVPLQLTVPVVEVAVDHGDSVGVVASLATVVNDAVMAY